MRSLRRFWWRVIRRWDSNPMHKTPLTKAQKARLAAPDRPRLRVRREDLLPIIKDES